MHTYLVTFIIALAIAYVVTPHVKDLAVKAGAMDAPDARKVHCRPIPRMGGLAIYMAFMVALLFTVRLYLGTRISEQVWGLILGGSIILAVGIVDDLKSISPKVKLLGQIVAATVLVFFDIKIDCITNPFGPVIDLGYFSIPLTILWVVGITNTVNLIDGLDGLAAGLSCIAAVTILLVAHQQGLWMIGIVMAALAGSSFGFLQHNFNPAKIFMGDTGSLFLGFVLATASVMGTVKSATTVALIVPFLALGLPIMDTTFAIIRRSMNGLPIFKPDKNHLHHRLLALGFSQKQAVLLMYVISACLGVSAIVLTEVNLPVGALIVGSVFVLAVVGAVKIGVLQIKHKNADV